MLYRLLQYSRKKLNSGISREVVNLSPFLPYNSSSTDRVKTNLSGSHGSRHEEVIEDAGKLARWLFSQTLSGPYAS